MLELLLTLLLAWLPASGQPPADPDAPTATTTAQVTRVIDGDTIDVAIDGITHRVRYLGIDTPEQYTGTTSECFAVEATAANHALVANQEVRLVADQEDRDTYDRLLRYVYVDDLQVNAELVRGGFARTLPIPPNNRYAAHFATLEQTAQTASVGLWAACLE